MTASSVMEFHSLVANGQNIFGVLGDTGFIQASHDLPFQAVGTQTVVASISTII
jgi:hypothetical protein